MDSQPCRGDVNPFIVCMDIHSYYKLFDILIRPSFIPEVSLPDTGYIVSHLRSS